jgi:hypothetical protein
VCKAEKLSSEGKVHNECCEPSFDERNYTDKKSLHTRNESPMHDSMGTSVKEKSQALKRQLRMMVMMMKVGGVSW